jgi:high-affinity Fe2+/Pb2+ permease
VRALVSVILYAAAALFALGLTVYFDRTGQTLFSILAGIVTVLLIAMVVITISQRKRRRGDT